MIQVEGDALLSVFFGPSVDWSHSFKNLLMLLICSLRVSSSILAHFPFLRRLFWQLIHQRFFVEGPLSILYFCKEDKILLLLKISSLKAQNPFLKMKKDVCSVSWQTQVKELNLCMLGVKWIEDSRNVLLSLFVQLQNLGLGRTLVGLVTIMNIVKR